MSPCTRLTVILAVFLGILSGCDQRPFLDRYKKAVQSGFGKIPEAGQIEALFGESDHFISSGRPNDWHTVAYFYGRYVLTMAVEVNVSPAFDEVTEVVGKKKFYLWEVRRVYDEGTQIATDFANDFRFTEDDWIKVQKAKGDFSVIGLTVLKDKPIPRFAEYEHAERRDRIPVHPPAN